MIETLSCALGALLPFECLRERFMQQALLSLLLLCPMAAGLGVQVVNGRFAFFTDAVSHSAFAGVALGIILSLDPDLAMILFGLAVGLAIALLMNRTSLSSDTATGVMFSGVFAFGLAVVSREGGVARDVQRFLYGDVLTIGDREVAQLALLFVAVALFEALAFNSLLYANLSATLARAHRVRVGLVHYLFAGLLALVVMFSVKAVGVLLVTALLVVPAATARNLASRAGAMFWWSLLVGGSSGVAGLLLSAQPWAGTATGATIVLCSLAWFGLSLLRRAVTSRS